MNNLFNKSFLKFTVGFIGIILFSFAFAAMVTRFDTAQSSPATVSGSR